MASSRCYLCRYHQLIPVIQSGWPLYRCPNCGLVQVSPLPSRKEVAKLYQGDYWKNYSYYESQLTAHQQYFRQKIAQIKPYQPAGRLLDVGCAVGVFLAEVQKQGYQPEGVDLSSYAVDQCKKNGLKAYTGDIFLIKNKNFYDIITCFEVIEHELNPLSMLRHAHSLLKNTGLIVVTVPNTDSWSRKLMGRHWFGYKNKEHLFHFNINSLSLILKQAGFTQIKIIPDASRPYLFLYFFERLNYYMFKSKIINRTIEKIKHIPGLNKLTININPWDNLIAFAHKR